MQVRRAVQRWTAVLAASATTLALAGAAAPPAAAEPPDPGVVALKDLVGDLVTASETLGTVGRLAEPLPVVGSTAGQVADFSDLVAKTLRDELATVEQWDDLDASYDLGDPARGRTGTLTVTDTEASGVRSIGLAVDVTRTLGDQPLSFASESPRVSLSSPDGVTVRARTRLDLTVQVEGATARLVAGPRTPALRVDVTADVPGSPLEAAVGILGVTLTETSSDDTPDAALSVVGRLADPDGDGRITRTELAAGGAGLFSFDLSPTDPGSVDLRVRVQAAADTGFDLPGVDATVSVTWPDISTGAPAVTATGLDPVAAFQNLSVRDLADLLGQVTSAISAAQRDNGENLPLPFLSGTLADAVKGAEVLRAFLDTWVVQPDDATEERPAGTPRFSSVQDLVRRLNAALTEGGDPLLPGADILATVAGYDEARARLPLHLELSREAPAPEPLVEQTVASSGTGVYGPTTLAGTEAFPSDLVGRRVTAGSSGGTVASVAGNTLTLTGPWTGGTPANGTPYAVAGPEVDAGTVNLGNLLKTGGKGVGDANAVRPTAQVRPDYTVALDLALDLSAPRTGEACTGGPGGAACPYERTNPDGTTTVVTAEPLPVERLLLANSGTLLAADLPMTASVDLSARAGFLGVRATGSVEVCRAKASSAACTAPGTDPMLRVQLTPVAGDPVDGLVPVKRFFDTLFDADGDPQRFSADVSVAARLSGSLSVPEAEQFLGTGTASFSARWDDIGTGAPVVDATDLSELTAFDIDPGNPQALFGVVVRVLQLLDEELRAGGGDGLLSQELPLVDRSLASFLGGDEAGGGPSVSYATVDGATRLVDSSRTDARAFPAELVGRSIVIGTQTALVAARPDGQTLVLSHVLDPLPAAGTPYSLRSELADALSLLTAAAPDTLQELVRRLDERLGPDSPVRFRTAPVGGSPALVLDVDWQRDYATATPISLDLGGGHTLAGAGAEGQASVAVSADVDVDLVVPLSGGALPTDLRILDTSSVTVDADATVSGSISASLGPLSVALGKPAAAAGEETAQEKAQARAHYRLGFAEPTAQQTGAAVGLGDFLDTVEPVVNGYEGGVSCGEAAQPTDSDLALCARFPLFVGSGTSWSKPTVPDIALRLPKSGDLFGLAPGQTVSGSDPRPRLQAPTSEQLSEAFAALLLDFGAIGDGLDAFLALVEQGLVTAANDGKLPLVGGDLQAGADFVGDLRRETDALFAEVESINGGKLPSISQVQDLLDTQFEQALEAAGANPQDFSLDLTCTLPSTDVTTATTSEDGPLSLTYAVLTQGETGAGATVEAAEGEVQTVTTAATATVTVGFSGHEAATGYTVVRSSDGGSTWRTAGSAPAGASGFSETLTEPLAGDAKTLPTGNPLVSTCDGVDMTTLQGVQLRADIGTGDPNAMDGGTIVGCADLPGEPCLEGTLPLDLGVPGLALRAARTPEGETGGLTGRLGFRIHLALELDRTRGFSVLTEDPDAATGHATPEIAIGASVDLTTPGTKPTASDPVGDPALAAELAFLTIGVYEDDPAAGPALAARVALDLSAPGARDCFDGCTDPALDGRLRFADLQAATSASDVVHLELRLEAHLDWFLKAELDAALPGVQAVLRLDWATVFDPTGATPQDRLEARGEDLTIVFDEVGFSAGGFFDAVLGPIVTQLKSVTGPLQPVVDTLYAPVPVLSDLSRMAGGGDVTLVTLAKTFSTLADGPDLDFVDTVAAVVRFVDEMPDADDGVVIPVGSFTVVGTDALSTPAAPGTDLVGTTSITTPDLRTALDAASTNGKQAFAGGDGSAASEAGFAFPLLTNPSSVFGLLMGQDVDLVTFDSGDLALGFTWRQSFGPVYAPPPVFITLSGSASVTARIVAGFDTYGIRKAFEEDPERTALAGIAQVLDGLYFRSTKADGTPLPVITLRGEIAAGAAVSAVVLTVGVEGGVRLTVAFAWNDPNGDGRFRLFEFGQAALRNPVCLFQAAGELSLFLKVYITVGVTPFSVRFDFTLVDVTLLDFSVEPDCEPEPPLLAGTTGSTLVLFAGRFGAAPRGDATWHNIRDGEPVDDVFTVTALHDYTEADAPFTGIRVQALGTSEDFLDEGIERVVLDGRGFAGAIRATFLSDGERTGEDEPAGKTAEFDREVVFLGGSGDDVVKTGTGNALLDGGGGADLLTSSDTAGRTVLVAGGGGGDGITTGNGGGTVAGDSTLGGSDRATTTQVTTTRGTHDLPGLVDWTTLTAPGEGASGGDDRIAVGLGATTVYGGPGNDSVGLAADDPRAVVDPDEAAYRSAGSTIVLGTGSDVAKGGTGADTVWTGPRTGASKDVLDGPHGVDEPGADDGPGTRNVVDTGPGGDTVFGSTGADLVTGGSTTTQGDHLRGGAGRDVVLGGLGTDALFGGPGEDWVVAEPATVGEEGAPDAFGVSRTVTRTPLTTVPSSKLLVGGDGADRVLGGDGASTLFGDRYEADACGAPVEPVLSDAPAEPSAGTPGRDLLLGGAGIDRAKAGGADDRVEAGGGADLLCGQAGDDEVFGGTGGDTAWGGTGADALYGDDGTDSLFGNDGTDRAFGSDGLDLLEGNDGADDLFGGSDDDVVVGGTRAPGRQDVGRDRLFGEAGQDVLVGDNSRDDGRYPVDLDGSVPGTGDGDELSGGLDDDLGYGGLGADRVLGDAGQDDLEGGPGEDLVRGGDGADQLVGGSSLPASPGTGFPDAGDDLHGDAGADVLTGDNAGTLRTSDAPTAALAGRGLPTAQVVLLDLGTAPAAGTSGGDLLAGGEGPDALLGQGGDDEGSGGDGPDLLEGGPAADDLRGDAGEDDVVGGSSESTGGTQPDAGDLLAGGTGADLLAGDNALVERVALEDASLVLQERGFALGRRLALLDLGHAPQAGRSGADEATGDDEGDAVFGQAGEDLLSGAGGADLVEGGPDADTLTGGTGDDDLVGGSSVTSPDPQPDAGDSADGGEGEDVLLGDNGVLRRAGEPHPLVEGRAAVLRGIDLHDLGDEADARNSGADALSGGTGRDVVLAQAGDDHADGGAGDDYLEGGPDRDLLQGRDGEDDLVGGGYTPLLATTHATDPAPAAAGQLDGADMLRGGADDDVLAGDNAYLLRSGASSRVFDRLGSHGSLTERRLVLLDRETEGRLTAPAGRSGGDVLAGGSGVDLGFGQDGDDLVSGGAGADHLQGNGGADLVRGDAAPEAAREGVTLPAFPAVTWPQAPAAPDDGPQANDGQDDLLGGSDVRGFRDGGDVVEGGGADDAALGDNGSLVRTVVDGVERTYSLRQRPTVERVAEPGLLSAGESTRFCAPVQGRCEVVGAFGDDTLYGDAGDDGLWAQDGDDLVRGGNGDDDGFGELGDDRLFGDAGQDVLLGDRGGVQSRRASGASVTTTLSSVPQESYTAVRDGSHDRRVDLQNDTAGQAWVGTGTQATMPLGGLVAGGRDRLRGGTGDDQLHAGAGDDLANGDSGGDELFGADGSDVLWGGKGCDPLSPEDACVGSDLSQRGSDDRFVDHLMGGRGGDSSNPVLGADVHDWLPRGSFADCVEETWPVQAGTDGAQDPCDWFRMTSRDDADASDDQHHQGTDWMYGGWDRDVMQADVAANGPNPGDRAMDWNGTYNLWSHCNAAYGGFNDVRQHSPAMRSFLQVLAYGMGAGQAPEQAAQAGTSAYRELQLAYAEDNREHASGSPYPSTPGHFDAPVACSG